MLTIHEGFPIKKMALYGSAAFVLGFTGTLTMLREYAPKDGAGNISVIHPSNKQDGKSNVSNQVPKSEDKDSQSASNPSAPLIQGTTPLAGGTLPTRQASPLPIASSNGASSGGVMTVSPAAPVASAPTVSSSPQPSSGGGSGGSTITTTQPAPTQPTSPLPSTSGVQQTVDGITKTTTGLLP